jgi:CRP-like cAMP-binding protein
VTDAETLAQLPLFRSTSQDALERLCDQAPPRDYDAGEPVFTQGDGADVALLLVSGRLVASVGEGDGAVEVGEVTAGEVAGEQALYLQGGRRSATLTALEPSRCLLLSRALLEAAHDNAAIVALENHLLGVMARRVRNTNRVIVHAWKASGGAVGDQGLRGQLQALLRGVG